MQKILVIFSIEMQSSGYLLHEVMFKRKSSLFLIDVNDDYHSM
jgi:hypothetical protein